MMHIQSDSADLDFRDHAISGNDAASIAMRELRLRKAARALVEFLEAGGLSFWVGHIEAMQLRTLIDAVKKEL